MNTESDTDHSDCESEKESVTESINSTTTEIQEPSLVKKNSAEVAEEKSTEFTDVMIGQELSPTNDDNVVFHIDADKMTSKRRRIQSRHNTTPSSIFPLSQPSNHLTLPTLTDMSMSYSTKPPKFKDIEKNKDNRSKKIFNNVENDVDELQQPPAKSKHDKHKLCSELESLGAFFDSSDDDDDHEDVGRENILEEMAHALCVEAPNIKYRIQALHDSKDESLKLVEFLCGNIVGNDEKNKLKEYMRDEIIDKYKETLANTTQSLFLLLHLHEFEKDIRLKAYYLKQKHVNDNRKPRHIKPQKSLCTTSILPLLVAFGFGIISHCFAATIL